MKDRRLDIRASDSDFESLTVASNNLEQMTGQKQNASKTVRAAVKIVAENKPDLFFVNRIAIRQVDANIEQGKLMLQRLFDALAPTLPDIEVSIADIAAWFGKSRLNFMVADYESIRQFVIDKLFRLQRHRYPGLQFTRENVQIPDLSVIFAAADKLIDIPEIQLKEVGVYWQCYDVAGDKITVLHDKVEQVKNRFRCYATTPEEKRKLSKVRVLCDQLSAFVKGDGINPERLSIPGLCHWDAESARFEPSEQYIKFSL